MNNKEEIAAGLDKLRLQADRLIQIANAIINSPETTLAWRSLQLAKGYLGKLKGLLGNPTPYTVADSPNAIPPTDGVYVGELDITVDSLYNVNHLRTEIKEFIDTFKNFFYVRGYGSNYSVIEILRAGFTIEVRDVDLFLGNVQTNLENASMQLGFDLAEQRAKALKEKEADNPPKTTK